MTVIDEESAGFSATVCSVQLAARSSCSRCSASPGPGWSSDLALTPLLVQVPLTEALPAPVTVSEVALVANRPTTSSFAEVVVIWAGASAAEEVALATVGVTPSSGVVESTPVKVVATSLAPASTAVPPQPAVSRLKV